MSYYANATTKRAYKVVREVKARASVVLLTAYGVTLEEPIAKLEENGYRRVSGRPRYATDWRSK